MTEYLKPKFSVPMPSQTTQWPHCKKVEGCTRLAGHTGDCVVKK